MTTPFKLKNGAQLLSTEAPGGIYNASQLKKLAELCEEGAAFVKATEDQRLALILPDEQVDSTREQLRALGVTLRPYQSGIHQPTSCIGELCPDSEQDALTTAIDVSQELDNIKSSSSLRIGINGCAKCCVPCHTLDIAVMGEAAGYRITLGGKNTHLPELGIFMAEGIPAAELPKILRRVVETYQTNATEGETLQEVLERNGSSAFIEALAPYSQDAGGGAEGISNSETTLPTAESDDLSFQTDEGVETPSAPEMVVSEDGGLKADTATNSQSESLEEGVPTAEPAFEESAKATEAPAMETATQQQQVLTEAGLAAAEKAVENKLLADDAEDDGMTAVAAAGTKQEAPMEIDTASLSMTSEMMPEPAMDINPSKSQAQGVPPILDINPSAQRNASAVMSSDVIIADDSAETLEAQGAPTLTEDQENQFEAELEASIEEEKVVEAGSETEEDESSERQRTLSMVQGSLDAKSPDLAEPIENIEISEEDSQALEIEDMELEPEIINDDLQSPIEADAGEETVVPSAETWALAALVPQGDSSIEFQFDSGAKVTFDLSRLALPSTGRTLRVGSQEFVITPQGEGYSVATGGMSVTLPGNKAA